MGAYFIHDGVRLISAGHCQDGHEIRQAPRTPGHILVVGAPPCLPGDVGMDQEWSMRERRVVAIQVPDAAMWARVRYQRDQLLASTDWRVTVSQEAGQPLAPEWVAYRQALRDVTQQADPQAIEWPAPPAG